MKLGIFTGMVLVIVIVLFLSVSQLGALFNGLIENTAQAKLAEGQAAAMVEQARAQGDLMRAQAAITLQGAESIAADRRAAHGLSDAQFLALLVGVCAVCAIGVWVALNARATATQKSADSTQLAEMKARLRAIEAQLCAAETQLSDDNAQDCATVEDGAQ